MSTDRPEPTAPHIHLNGSSAAILLAGNTDARAAIREAIEKFSATAPNMRDFYSVPNGEVLFAKARAEYTTHLRHLEEMLEDLAKIARAIRKQDDAIRRSRMATTE